MRGPVSVALGPDRRRALDRRRDGALGLVVLDARQRVVHAQALIAQLLALLRQGGSLGGDLLLQRAQLLGFVRQHGGRTPQRGGMR